MTEDPTLSRYLLPHDIDGAVYLFRRRQKGSGEHLAQSRSAPEAAVAARI